MAVSQGIWYLLTNNAAVRAQLGTAGAIYKVAAGKQPPPNFVVMHIADAPPAEHSLDGPSALIDGEFQFDSYGPDQDSARALSQAVRDALKNYSGGLNDNTQIQFYQVSLDTDDPYEEGGGVGGLGYIYRSLLRLRAFYTEPGT